MAFELEVFVNRSGTPAAHSTVVVMTQKGEKFTDGYVADNGMVTVKVPEKEPYKILIRPYTKNNERTMPPQQNKLASLNFDLDKYGTR